MDASDKRLIRKLDVVIALLLKDLRQDDRPLTLREQIAVLNDLGVGPAEIGQIIGRPNKYVSKELAGLRKRAKRTVSAQDVGTVQEAETVSDG